VFTPSRILGLTAAIGLALPATAQTPTSTPPARVGQLANVNGSVSYNGAGSNGQWVAATVNYPLTAGDSLFTQTASQAAVAVDSSTLTLAANTELQITQLDDTSLAATESQGELFLNLTDLQPGQNVTINTPRGAVSITQNGQYDIAAGDAQDPTTVAVLAGAASIGQLEVPAGQEGYVTGTDQTTAQLGGLQRDDFMNQVVAELAPPPPPYAPPVVEQMTGAAELSNYGTWDQSPQYGAVWYPNVDSGWAPYREGHWAFVAPWGWTWVDVEPWGFAPFHYGRWIQDGGRWGWVAASAYTPGGGYGPDYQPVYAPAVVTFFGLGAGVAITAAVLSSGSVGWVPLGPGEAYHPYYHADPHYIQQINRVDVRNYQNITINHTTVINNYVNRNGATYIGAGEMARGESVRNYGHEVPAAMFAQARPVEGGAFNQAIRPSYAPRAAEAPRLTDFAQRRDVPAPAVSHETFQPDMRPQPGEAMRPQGVEPPQGFHPQNMPEYHPPAGQAYHPEAMPAYHPPVQQYHPQAAQPQEQYHPQGFQPEQQYHPQEQHLPHVYAPPAQQYHAPEAPAYQPPVQQYHPQAEAPRPQPEQFQPQYHPQEESRPQPAPVAPQHGAQPGGWHNN